MGHMLTISHPLSFAWCCQVILCHKCSSLEHLPGIYVAEKPVIPVDITKCQDMFIASLLLNASSMAQTAALFIKGLHRPSGPPRLTEAGR